MTDRSLRHVAGVVAPLLRDNIDTDVIAPSRLQVAGLGKTGYESILFGNWRYDENGGERPDFILNQADYRTATILLTGANFGCGSSRESAVWALRGFGIKAIIAPSFGSIFAANCYRNTILPLALPPDKHARLVAELHIDAPEPPQAEIDLEHSRLRATGGPWRSFPIDERPRQLLLEGLDDIDDNLRHRRDIDTHRARDQHLRPWLYRPTNNRKDQ
ncbi:3-isopropylmalate dehydratase small subunit [Mycobacterium noviomagense]|uniref:3-isopropylmalate dehydratase small subunit n=1 Tax=Mycobacterium noviomagense TaxID=459858 RepID=A0A7I7P962_9MYCO|nr:3-isopropylmalate dehydratase small subunit [Mycobacterium noviomagense]ORB18268.1 3-isopropylmalate dehydratase small subunit [Mycobacterium noviomagense]BBY05111.1 3-isopropylmalate dehydratase small subunit [Mycobacterium noviomagense]